MEPWQSEAYNRFPELKDQLDECDSPHLLWACLYRRFEKAYDTDDKEMVHRIYDFAWWCCEQPENDKCDLGSVVVVGFFEDIPRHPKALADMPNWWPLEEVKSMKNIFSYMVGEDGYAKILAQYDAQQGAPVRRPSPLRGSGRA